MNRSKTSSLIFRKKQSLLVIFIISLIFMIMTACATRNDVQDIVAKSNAALITATITGTGSTDSTGMPYAGIGKDPTASESKAWMASSAKIDAFIEAHPDQKVTNNALRMRQAILLLSYKQYNLAKAAFNMVEPQHLATARDKALYNVRDHLVWWFGLNKKADMSLSEFRKADMALNGLQTEIDGLNESPDIRDYLAEMRAWIALNAALNTTSEAKAKTYLEDGINHYARIFTDEDLKELKNNPKPSEWNVSMQIVRRRLRAKAVIKHAGHVIETQGIDSVFESEAFSKLIGPQ
jgi:hypothetical protein